MTALFRQRALALFIIFVLTLSACESKGSRKASSSNVVGANLGDTPSPTQSWGGSCGDSSEQQSPIDIHLNTVDALENKSDLKIEVPSGEYSVYRKATVLELSPLHDEGSLLASDKNTYRFQNFHFHFPGEHRIEGQEHPLEVHFVFSDSHHKQSVVATLVDEGPTNDFISELLESLQTPALQLSDPQKQIHVNLSSKVEDLLPTTHSYFSYFGSLTLPPCPGGVLWQVLSQNITMSRAQLESFSQLLSQPVARPIQPLLPKTKLFFGN